jgi:SAM-dependent methyltransferase
MTPGGELVSEDGAHRYLVSDGVPLLIDPERSLFDPVAELGPDGAADGRSRLRSMAWSVGRKVVPSISLNVRADANFRRLGELLSGSGTKRVLLVGGAVEGHGVDELVRLPHVETVETDVVVGPRTQVLADAHDLPFADGTFDAVVCQGVLGNVADPQRVVDEIHRVLAPDGYVYA